jgi:hypothetical protein
VNTEQEMLLSSGGSTLSKPSNMRKDGLLNYSSVHREVTIHVNSVDNETLI